MKAPENQKIYAKASKGLKNVFFYGIIIAGFVYPF